VLFYLPIRFRWRSLDSFSRVWRMLHISTCSSDGLNHSVTCVCPDRPLRLISSVLVSRQFYRHCYTYQYWHGSYSFFCSCVSLFQGDCNFWQIGYVFYNARRSTRDRYSQKRLRSNIMHTSCRNTSYLQRYTAGRRLHLRTSQPRVVPDTALLDHDQTGQLL